MSKISTRLNGSVAGLALFAGAFLATPALAQSSSSTSSGAGTDSTSSGGQYTGGGIAGTFLRVFKP